MKDLEVRLKKISDHVWQEKEAAIELLKDYIRQHGEIDWSDDERCVETVFYDDFGYYTDKIDRVWISDGNLMMASEKIEHCEDWNELTVDTVLDILRSVIEENAV